MYSKKMFVVIAGVVAASLAATAQDDQSNIPSIVIDRAAVETLKKPLSENEREYWQCVLEYVKGTQSDDAVNVILAACRALYGVK